MKASGQTDLTLGPEFANPALLNRRHLGSSRVQLKRVTSSFLPSGSVGRSQAPRNSFQVCSKPPFHQQVLRAQLFLGSSGQTLLSRSGKDGDSSHLACGGGRLFLTKPPVFEYPAFGMCLADLGPLSPSTCTPSLSPTLLGHPAIPTGSPYLWELH